MLGLEAETVGTSWHAQCLGSGSNVVCVKNVRLVP
jgi:hypothetical protein